MAQKTIQTTRPALIGSWDLVKPSIQLVRQNVDTLLWLVVLPTVLILLANQLIAKILERFGEAFSGQTTVTDAELHEAFRRFGHDLTATTPGQLAILLILLGLLWNLLVYPAVVAFTVRAVKNQQTDIWSSLRAGWHYFWRVYGLSILVGLIVCVGLLFFIVPGLIFLRRYVLAPYYLVDRDLSITQALKTSAAESKQFSGYIWGTLGVVVAFNFLSSACSAVPVIGFIIGLAVAYLYFFGLALRYKTIQDATPVSAASKV